MLATENKLNIILYLSSGICCVRFSIFRNALWNLLAKFPGVFLEARILNHLFNLFRKGMALSFSIYSCIPFAKLYFSRNLPRSSKYFNLLPYISSKHSFIFECHRLSNDGPDISYLFLLIHLLSKSPQLQQFIFFNKQLSLCWFSLLCIYFLFH